MDLEFRPVDVRVGDEAWIEQVKKGRCLFRLVVGLYIAQFVHCTVSNEVFQDVFNPDVDLVGSCYSVCWNCRRNH